MVLMLVSAVNFAFAQQAVPEKPRVLISTDVGGTDPDDNQSVAHLLMYTDKFDTEGLVSSPSYGNGNKEELLKMIDLYEKDFRKLSRKIKGLSSPDYLRSVCKQGRKGAVPYAGYMTATEGSDWIVQCARREDARPLWVLVWGGLDDLAQALHDAPDIKDRIRVYWIGGPNKKWSVNSYMYIVEHFPDLWFIECNASYRGFIADKNVHDAYNTGYYETYLKGAGYLGEDFINYYKGLPKMGDTPSLLYMMDGNPDDPSKESWGGSFVPIDRSPYVLFNRAATAQDTVPVYSVVEFRMRGPVLDIPADSICFTLEIAKQKWGGFYLGDGLYAVRHSSNYARTLTYTISSDIPGFPNHEGAITMENIFPGRSYPSDFQLGEHWYSDRPDAELFDKNMQGVMTVKKWRNEAMEDWGQRLKILKK